MLIQQIQIELGELTEEISKIEFGEVLIEIKHNRVSLITYKGQKKPTPPKPDIEMLTKRPQTDNIFV